MRTTFLFALLSMAFLGGLPAHAEGLAMHGTPKLGVDFTSFPYADVRALKGGRLVQAQYGSFVLAAWVAGPRRQSALDAERERGARIRTTRM